MVFAQIGSDELGVPIEDFQVAVPGGYTAPPLLIRRGELTSTSACCPGPGAYIPARLVPLTLVPLLRVSARVRGVLPFSGRVRVRGGICAAPCRIRRPTRQRNPIPQLI